MEDRPAATRSRSDALWLGLLNATAYLWCFWRAGFVTPHDGTYLCLVGGIIGLVPAARELACPRLRRGALLGALVSAAVLGHIMTSPCSGACK